MKPRKYPYSGRPKLIKRELPRLVRLGELALHSKLIEHLEAVNRVERNYTKLFFKIPKPFFAYEEKNITVHLAYEEVLRILNRY